MTSSRTGPARPPRSMMFVDGTFPVSAVHRLTAPGAYGAPTSTARVAMLPPKRAAPGQCQDGASMISSRRCRAARRRDHAAVPVALLLPLPGMWDRASAPDTDLHADPYRIGGRSTGRREVP